MATQGEQSKVTAKVKKAKIDLENMPPQISLLAALYAQTDVLYCGECEAFLGTKAKVGRKLTST